MPDTVVRHSEPWRLVAAGLRVDVEPSRCIAELRDASDRPYFVELPALLANARQVTGLDRLAAAIADGALRLHHEDRALWDAFMGSLQ
ncbi:hypothetical protein A9P79_25685 [Cupriavidus taiwanensis]|nr:hypothetical protein A9P79_25685 [Cupriavidus taiwanensis]